MAVFLPFFGYGQIINESIVRASIASNIPTNANKQITAAMLRPVLGQIVSFVKSGANGVTADSLATENYIPFFKTTGSIANSPFRVGTGTVGLGTAASSAATLSIIAHSDGSTPNPYAHNLRLGAKEYLGVKSSGIDFDGGGGDAKNGSIVNLDGSMSITAAKEVSTFGVDSVSVNGGKGVFIRSTSGQIRFSTGAGVGSPRMNITGAGNVGIGTLLPLTKHHVAGANDEWLHTVSSTDGSLFNNGSIRIAGLNTAFGAPTIQARSADGSIYRALVLDAAAMNIKIQGNERFTIDQFGNVGIRTSSPFTALDVNGIVNTRTDTWLATLTGKVGVRRTSPMYTLDVGGTFRSDSNTYVAAVEGGLVVGTAGYEGYKLDVSGWTRTKANTFLATEGGGVGIGTTSPLGTLHVVSSVPDPFFLEQTSATGYAQTIYKGTAQKFQTGVGGGSEATFGVANKFFIYDGTAGFMRLVIDQAGKVGINTTNPNYQFEVAGTVGIRDGLGVQVFRNGSSSVTNHMYFANAANNRAYNWQLNEDGSAADFWGFAGAWNRLMTVNSNGNIGINTASPLAKLHVNGTGDTRIRVGNESQQWSMAVSQFGAGNFTLLQEDVAIRLFVSAANGNVGIGTTSPTSQLDVDGVDGFNQIRARKSATPSATAATDGNTGNIVWDDNYIYIKTSAGWKRAALSTF